MRITWSEIAQATFIRFMADQAGMLAVNRAVEALTGDPAPPGAFVRGAYRRLRIGSYRVLYEVEGDLITIVRGKERCSRAWSRPGRDRAGRHSPRSRTGRKQARKDSKKRIRPEARGLRERLFAKSPGDWSSLRGGPGRR